jgi:hypothetical protein
MLMLIFERKELGMEQKSKVNRSSGRAFLYRKTGKTTTPGNKGLAADHIFRKTFH